MNPENEDFIIGVYDVEREHQRMINTERDLGKEEGLQEGMVLGEEKGLKKGIKKGLQEGVSKRNIEIAKNLLKLNVDLNTISKGTGLSVEEIKNLK